MSWWTLILSSVKNIGCVLIFFHFLSVAAPSKAFSALLTTINVIGVVLFQCGLTEERREGVSNGARECRQESGFVCMLGEQPSHRFTIVVDF